MSDTVWVALIAIVPSIVSGLTYRRITKVHVQINSRMDQLIESVRAEATAKEQVAGFERDKWDGTERRHE